LISQASHFTVLVGVRLRPTAWILLLALSAACPARSPAQQPANNDWIGKRVVQKYANFQLKIEKQVINQNEIEIYRVEQVNGSWMWLYAPGISGWAPTDQVVPVDQAVEFFTNHLRANPGDPHGYTMRAFVWVSEKKELDIALADYNEAIRLAPTKSYVYGNRSTVWADKKEYDKALADYNGAIRLDPKDPWTYFNRGNVWGHKDEYDKAVEDYNEAIKLKPKYFLAYGNCGHAWYAKKEYDKAVDDYNEAIRLDPKFAGVYRGRGDVWSVKKEFDKAIADYSEAIRLDPKDAMAVISRAFALFSAGRPARAVEDVNRVTELQGWQGEYSIYAIIVGHFAYLRDGRGDQAKSMLERAAERCNHSVWPYPVVRFLRGDITEVNLLAAATDNDKMTEARCYLGLAAIRKQEKDTARAHFRWVAENGKTTFLEFHVAGAELDRMR
jgi:tetratricopeptide (TPR) repeat protein